jgi:hypothetical protein
MTWPTTHWIGDAADVESLRGILLSRIFGFLRDGPFAQAITQAIADRHAALRDATNEIVEGFDIASGTGDRLDKLGALIDRPRDGLDDEYYRRLLLAQSQLVLSSKGATETLLRIVEALTDNEIFEYSETYPAQITIGAVLDGDYDPTAVAYLAQMLYRARAGGVAIDYVLAPPNVFLNDSIDAPQDGAGIIDSSDSQIDDAQLLASIRRIA